MSPDIDDLAHVLKEYKWEARTNDFGLHIVGPVCEDGLLNVLGMGRTFGEALDMARRSKEK